MAYFDYSDQPEGSSPPRKSSDILARGTEGSNRSSSSGESGANLIFGGESHRWPPGICGGEVGRDAQGISISRQPTAISLSGPIPVPQGKPVEPYSTGREEITTFDG